MGCMDNPSTCCAIICCLVLSCGMAGFSLGIWATDLNYEDQLETQDWPAASNCTVGVRLRTDSYCCGSCSNQDGCCRYCDYTSEVAVTSPSFPGTRTARWCGVGFTDTDRGDTLDIYIATHATVECWYENDSDQSDRAKLSDCDADTGAYIAVMVALSIFLGIFFCCCIGFLCMLCVKSDRCCESICSSVGACGRCIGDSFDHLIECFSSCCGCCRSEEYDHHYQQGNTLGHKNNQSNLDNEGNEIILPPGGGLSRTASYQDNNKHLKRQSSWTDPQAEAVAPPAYGFLGRKPSVAVYAPQYIPEGNHTVQQPTSKENSGVAGAAPQPI